MATYSQAPCEYVYKVSSLEKIVDGDTIDVAIDLGSMYSRNNGFVC